MIEDCGSAAPQVGGRALGVVVPIVTRMGGDGWRQERSGWRYLAPVSWPEDWPRAAWLADLRTRARTRTARQGWPAPHPLFLFRPASKIKEEGTRERREGDPKAAHDYRSAFFGRCGSVLISSLMNGGIETVRVKLIAFRFQIRPSVRARKVSIERAAFESVIGFSWVDRKSQGRGMRSL